MLKIIILGLISAILIVYLKTVNQELAILATICSGIILTLSILNYFSTSIELLNEIIKLTKVNGEIYSIIIKITIIAYLIEFGAGIVEDFGVKSLSTKMIVAGKFIILIISAPIFYGLINLFIGLL